MWRTLKMVCELVVKQMEKKLGRKLSETERKIIEDIMHHSQIDDYKIEEVIA